MEHVSQSALISLALYGAAVGVLLGIIYDVFRILRIAVEPSNRLRLLSTVTGSETADGKKPHGETVRTVVIAIEDIIYSVICAVIISVMIFHINSGHPRWFILLGTALAFFVYYFTIGKIVMLFSSYIFLFVRTVFMFVMKLTLFPLLKLFRWLFGIAAGFMRRLIRAMAGKILYSRELKAAERGYGMADSVIRELSAQKESENI